MNLLREGLKKIKEANGEDNLVANESQVFFDCYHQWKFGQRFTVGPSYRSLHKFYVSVTDGKQDDETLPSKLLLEARTLFLQRMSDVLLDNEELESLRALLDEQSSENNLSEKIIGYPGLKEVISKASSKCASYYSAKAFAQLHTSEILNAVDIVHLFTYAMRKTWLKKTRIGLSVYDTLGKGYLRESELEFFVSEIIPDCPQLRELKKAFQPFYICTVVRKFMFFLDPMRTGKVRIKDILVSNFLDDLLVLRNDELPEESEESNWFSASSALQVYGQYLTLDKDCNGTLSKRELIAYGTGTLTEIFIERVFQEVLTYEGEMDYKAYLEFVLALENKQEHQSLRYYFTILDINCNGYLDVFSINYFFRGVQEGLKKHDQEPVDFEDVQDELFDMVRPADPAKITFNDLLESQKAEHFVSILTDLNEFWNYENKECN